MIGWFLSLVENLICKRNPAYVASLTHLGTRRIIVKIQLFRLRRTVKYAYERSEFYRRVFRERGIKPSNIRSISDITKIPFTTSLDLQRDPYAFLAVPREKIARVFTSGGTTGSPKKIFYSKRDVANIAQINAIGLAMLGIKESDTIQIMLSYGRPSWIGGAITEIGGQKLGATVIPSGDTLCTEEQIQTIKELGSTVLVGYPPYLHRVTEEASKNEDLTQLGIHTILLGAQPWPESLRKYLQEKWNAKVYDAYGLTEIGGAAGECRIQNGLHINEFDLLPEVVDPSTGEQLEPGEEGDLVFTTLNREGMPLLRYRTHDISHFIEGPCGCELNTMRIGRIPGRTDDMVKVGTGEFIFPKMFDQVLVNLEGVLDYQIVLEKEGYKDKIVVRAEVNEKTELMKQRLFDALFQVSPIARDIEVTQTISMPEIILLEPGTLKKASEIKVRKIIDSR